MSKLSEPFHPDKSKSVEEQLDDIFNHIREQIDFLCLSAEYQNHVLKKLYENAYNSSNKSEDSNK